MNEPKYAMKPIVASILLLHTASAFAQKTQSVSATAESPQSYYQRGLTAMNQGDIVAAEKNLRAALQAKPQDPHVRYALNELQLHRDQIAARYREYMMKRTKIAKVEYADASLSECLDHLSIMVKNATDQRFAPNFVIKDSMGRLKSRRVTLQLANVPASQILQYLASASSCKVVYEQHTIVVEAE